MLYHLIRDKVFIDITYIAIVPIMNNVIDRFSFRTERIGMGKCVCRVCVKAKTTRP